MLKKHLSLAVLVTLVWGVNFPITKLGLRAIDPFVLTGIRFALAALPLVFFIHRPAVKFSYVAAYGFIFGLGMWGVINYGIQVGVSPGIASLIIQLSVFFTMGWGFLLFKEKIRGAQMLGAVLALIGLAGIISTQEGNHAVLGVMLIVLSAVAWSVGNVIIKKSGVKEIFSFMVWASLIPPIPLFLTAWLMHGSAPFESLQASLDLAYGHNDVAFDWEGDDDMHEVRGSGSAELLDDGSLEIEFEYHRGDDAILKAVRDTSSAAC